MKLKNIFSEITNKLDELDEQREQILKRSRKMIRECSIAIKSIHREEFDKYETAISNIQSQHEELKSLVKMDPSAFSNYLKTPEQEYVEAIGLYHFIKSEDIPSPNEIKVDDINYLLGLADIVGELRRYILDQIRQDKVDKIEDILNQMEKIYNNLFTLDYPKGLTKDLRHKTDVVRNIIEKTRGDISLSIQLNKLNKHLENK